MIVGRARNLQRRARVRPSPVETWRQAVLCCCFERRFEGAEKSLRASLQTSPRVTRARVRE